MFGYFLNVFLVVFLLSFFSDSVLPFTIQGFVMFENMIMIKRTPKMVRLSDPAMTAPLGIHSNFVNPSNLRTEGLILVTICLILSTLVVSMRMWTKSRVVRKMVLEDCKCFFSFVRAFCSLLIRLF